ncbi:MAG TPA: cbb3-type cytochrome oxidase assembly protein CcoS [Ignavibacteria bacterium]|nr:cbb3-type cytochrome oxidase assembly protein CcoS [Ignavibacteria bacterium]
MSVIFVLIFFSVLVAAGFLIAFIWSVKSGQYNDRYTPSVRMLFEDSSEEELNKKLYNKKETSV